MSVARWLFRHALSIFAALLLVIGLAESSSVNAAVQAGNSVPSASGRPVSHAAALAARRALVRHDTSLASERASSARLGKRLQARAPKLSPAQLRAGVAAERAAASGHGAAVPGDSGDSGYVDEMEISGPAGLVSVQCAKLCLGYSAQGSVFPGEELTVSAEVFDFDTSGVSEPTTVTITESCGAGTSLTVGSATVTAPSIFATEVGAPVTASFAAPGDCLGPYTPGNANFTVTFTATPADGTAGAWSVRGYWGSEPILQIMACPGTLDSAGAAPAQGSCGDPVNTATGSFGESATDATLKSPGYPLTISRSYSSANTASGALGPGWNLPWQASLAVGSPSAGDVTFTAENGDQYVYTPDGSGGFGQPSGARSVLAAVTDSSGTVTGYTLTAPDHHMLRFSAAGLLTSEVDATGRGLTFAYNASGQVSSITDAAGQQVTLSYSGSLLASISLPDGQNISYGYTGGQLTSVVAPADTGSAITNYTYNSAGLLASVQDPDGNTVTNTYNSAGQVTSQKDGAGNVTTFSYTTTSSGLSETDVTDPNGGITTHLYGGGLLLESIDPMNGQTTNDYNGYGQLIATTDPLGNVTQMTYDANGDMLSKTAPLGNVQSWTYDASGNTLTAADANNNTTMYTYNSMDEVTSATTPSGGETTYGYDSSGNLVSEVDPRGNVSGANAASYTTTDAYNAAGQLTSVTNPDGDQTQYTYDSMGYQLTVTDPLGHVTSYTYDSAEQVKQVTTPAGTTKYSYDLAGNLASRTDPDNNAWTYAYDGDNRLHTSTDPLGKSSTYGYDGNGNQNAFTDARGITTTTTYDGDNRPTKITYSDGTPAVSYSYDADGRATSVTDGTGTRTLTYNADSNLTSDGGFSYGYDNNGSVNSRTYPDGTAISYQYNNDGQVSSLTTGSATTAYTYDPAGNLVSAAKPNGVTESKSYDGAGQLTSVKDATSSATLDAYGLTLNKDGQPTQVAVTQNVTAQPTRYYGYDSSGRLTSECYSSSGSSACSAASAGTTTGTAADPGSVSGAVTGGETGICLDDTSDSGTAGTKIQIWHCLGDASQTLSVTAAGHLQVAGGCVTASGAAAGSAVVLEPCAAGSAAQAWQAGSGNRLVNRASGLCLDDPGGSTAGGTQVDVAACNGSVQQEWGLPGTGADWITDGVTGICADDSGGSTTAGAKVVIWTCDGNTGEQKWTVTAAGQMQIHSLCAQATSSATGLVLESCTGATSQQWDSGPDGWVWNVGAQDCLSDIGASTTNGIQIVITGCATNPQQSWRLPPQRINSGVLASGVSGECAANSGGTKAVISPCSSTSAAQQWAIGNDANIRTLSNLCWTLNGGATASGTTITLVTCGANIDQEFAQGPGIAPWVTSVDGSAAGLCVTDPGGSTTSGTQLQIAACSSGSSSQKWPLPPTTTPWTPTGVSVTAAAAAATVSWAPASNGGDTLTGYTVTATPGGETATAGPYATSATVAGLTPGTAYTFTITANSLAGTSSASAATTAVTPGNETSYTYDAAGNMSNSQTDGITTTNTFNADEELTKSVTGSATTPYGYDADGNQTSAGNVTYTYNATHELTGAVTPTGNFTYAYDAYGNVTSTALNGTQIQGTIWDTNGSMPMAAEDTSSGGATAADYIYGPASTLASVNTPGGTYYAVSDWLGSVTGLVSSSGTQVSSTTYSAYGTLSTTGGPLTSIGYTGSYTLPGGTGLDDMRARDYNPGTGGFETIDPQLSQSGQPYAYASDNPVTDLDPTGTITCPGWVPGCGVVTNIQHHWRGIAQGAVDVTAAVGMGVCVGVTGGDCVILAPIVGGAVGGINNWIAGPGSQTPADYGHAIGEGFVSGGISLVCPACLSSPLAAGLAVSGLSAVFGAADYSGSTQCASLQGAFEAAIIAAISQVAYPFDKEYYHFVERDH